MRRDAPPMEPLTQVYDEDGVLPAGNEKKGQV